jgi:hypothetical protein
MNDSNNNQTPSTPPIPQLPRVFERLGQSLYWKGDVIVARVRVNGKPTWRSTGTNNPAEARAWLKKWKSEVFMLASGIEPKGVVLHRARVTAGEMMDAYVAAGQPTRKMRAKRPSTIECEKICLKPLRMFFGNKQVAALTLADWRGAAVGMGSSGLGAESLAGEARETRHHAVGASFAGNGSVVARYAEAGKEPSVFSFAV